MIEVVPETASALADYARVPIAFEVRSVLEVAGEEGAWALAERAVEAPYIKDYDALPGEGPAEWALRFDVSRWAFWGAWLEGRRVGGAALQPDGETAALWDLRVAPDARGHGAGAALFRAAERWAREHGHRALEVETQNVNVAACRFYAAMGCVLARVDPHAYPTLPGETRLIWRRVLG